jgi:hypothetical protein
MSTLKVCGPRRLRSLWGFSLHSLHYLSHYQSLNHHWIFCFLSQGKFRRNWVRALSLAELSSYTLPMVLSYDLFLFCVFGFKLERTSEIGRLREPFLLTLHLFLPFMSPGL